MEKLEVELSSVLVKLWNQVCVLHVFSNLLTPSERTASADPSSPAEGGGGETAGAHPAGEFYT